MDIGPISTTWLTDAVAGGGGDIAVSDDAGRELSYDALLAQATPPANAIRSEAGPGGLCLIDLPPGIRHATAMHACMLAGMPFQTLRPGLPDRERERQRPAAAVMIGAEWLDSPGPRAAGDAPGSPPRPDDVLCRVLTSGTSGTPRPVDLTWANHHTSATASAQLLPLDRGERWLCCLPLDHVGGLSILLRTALAGAEAVVHPGFAVDPVAEALERVDLVSLVPTQLRRLLASEAPLAGPRAILLGGAPAPASLIEEAIGRGARVFPTYGLTEACSQVCTLAPDEIAARPGSSGRPLPGIEVEVETGRADGIGEILISGPTVAPGACGPDGMLRSGDLGRRDEDGYIWVEGRADELIVSGGENVRPEEVEAALLEHPLVADAGVAGREDPEWGTAVVAWVLPTGSDGLTAIELIDFCKQRLAAPKVPKRIEMVAELPRTASGKLQRRRLG